MRTIKWIFTLIAMLGLCRTSHAADPGTPPTPPTPPDRTVIRPDAPRANVPVEVRELVKKFDASRAAFLEKEAALRKELKGATAADRDKILAQMKELRDQWLERTKKIRDDIKDDVRPRLEEKRKQIIDSAKPPTTRHGSGN